MGQRRFISQIRLPDLRSFGLGKQKKGEEKEQKAQRVKVANARGQKSERGKVGDRRGSTLVGQQNPRNDLSFSFSINTTRYCNTKNRREHGKRADKKREKEEAAQAQIELYFFCVNQSSRSAKLRSLEILT